MMGKEIGYEVLTRQMQYDVNNKKTDQTDQTDPCFICFGGNGPGKRRKYQVSWGHYEILMRATFAPRLIGLLAS